MNLSQLQQAIQDRGYTTDTAAAQTTALNAAYREVCGMQRWPFLEKQDATLSTVAGTSAYVLPMSDWLNLDAVRMEITATQQFTNLRYEEPQAFRDLEHVDRDQSTPFMWSWFNGLLHFYPNPDAVYLVTIDYIKQPPDLAAGGDVPVIPTTYHDILVWGAIVSLGFRERDWLGRQFAAQEKDQLLKRMEEEYLLRQRQTASHVKRSGTYDTQLPYPFVQSGW